jgi:hypothetical protein
MAYTRFLINQYGAEEVLPLFSPQIYRISLPDLTEWPAQESLDRVSIFSSEIYILYNALALYIFVGAQADVYYIE